MKIDDFYKFKKGKKIVMITCYDWSQAIIVSQTDIDAVLIGDSLSMTIYGYESTIYATIDMMKIHTEAVRKGLKDKMIITDMPFMSFKKGKYFALDVACELIKSGADAVKIEGVDGHEDTIKYLIQSGIPVMGHIGITPQYEKIIGRFSKKGKKKEERELLIKQAKTLQDLGCFSIVLECVDEKIAEKITKILKIPTIGIGSGSKTDGQIRVFHDIVGLYPNPPSFAKIYVNISEYIKEALNQYITEVKNNS